MTNTTEGTTAIAELAETRDLAATAYEARNGQSVTASIYVSEQRSIQATVTRRRGSNFEVEANGNTVTVEGVTNSGPRKVHGDRARTCERIEQAIEQAATA